MVATRPNHCWKCGQNLVIERLLGGRPGPCVLCGQSVCTAHLYINSPLVVCHECAEKPNWKERINAVKPGLFPTAAARIKELTDYEKYLAERKAAQANRVKVSPVR